MQFRLLYEGPIPPRQRINIADIHEIRMALHPELSVTLLRQQPPGQLLGEGGDIDNRLKTLLDALRVPNTAEAQPANIGTRADNDPIHCLLQDDALVMKVSVETDRLLRPAADAFDLVAIIQVRVRLTMATMANLGLQAQ